MEIFSFDDYIFEKVNFFEKGVFWKHKGKKVKVIGSIPQNDRVLRLQQVDDKGNAIGEPFVGYKGEMGRWSEQKKVQPSNPVDQKPENLDRSNVDQPTKPTKDSVVDKRFKELMDQWKLEQKRLGKKNLSPGEGTRERLRKQSESEINFYENKDVDLDMIRYKKRSSYEVVDRLETLIKSKKVTKMDNVLKYVDFIKSKMSSGDSVRMSMN